DGELVSASNSAGAYSFGYDGGLLVSQSSPGGLSLTFHHDHAQQLTQVSDSQGGVLTFSYDGTELVGQSYQGPGGTLREDFSHDQDGQLAAVQRYADLAGTQLVGSSSYGYDGTLLTSLVHRDGSGNVLASFGDSYDAAERLASQTEDGTTTGYSYDATGQLTQAGAQSFGWDPNGNPTPGGAPPGPGNRLVTDGARAYSY